jgi:molecular chaperone DnaK (HSP70)
VLRKMKKTAEDYLGEEVSEAVITVPPTSTTRSARRPRTPAASPAWT